MHRGLQALARLAAQANSAPLEPTDLARLGPDARLVAGSILVLKGVPLDPPERGGANLPLAWAQAWATHVLERSGQVEGWQGWLQLCELPGVLLHRLSQAFLTKARPDLARPLAAAIHPLDKRDYCLAHLELALAESDHEALGRALRAADAGPMIAQGAEECEALGQALVRLSRSDVKPDLPAVQQAHQRLLRLAETRVDRDGRSYEVRDAVLGLVAASDPAWWELARPLVAQLHTPELRVEAELALRSRFPDLPRPQLAGRLTEAILKQPGASELLPEDLSGSDRALAARWLHRPDLLDSAPAGPALVAALGHFGRFDEAEALVREAGSQSYACREALVEALVAAGERRRALSLAAESPQKICAWALHELPRELVPEALALLQHLPPFDRWMALRTLGPSLEPPELLAQLLLLGEDRSRARAAAECAAPWLARGEVAVAIDLVEQALLRQPQTPSLEPQAWRDLSCEVWLQRGQPERVVEALQGCLDPAALALLARTGTRPERGWLASLAKLPESRLFSGDLGASLAHLVEPRDEAQVAALFKGFSDPLRAALGAFLRERAHLRGSLPFAEWLPRLKVRDRPCPIVLKILAPWLAVDPQAEALLEAMPDSGTNAEEALVELARQRALQGQLEGCWKLAQRLKPYPLSTLCEALQEVAPAETLVETLKALPRKGMDASTKVVLDRRLAQAELLAGRPKAAFKALEKMGPANPVAPAQLAGFLWSWLERNPQQNSPERMDVLWRALTLVSPAALAQWAPRLIPAWHAHGETQRQEELLARLPTPADQAVVWMCLGLPERALAAASEPGKHLEDTFAPTLRCALELEPAVGLQFLSRLRHLAPRAALRQVEGLLAEPADPRLTRLLQLACERSIFDGELGRKLTILWGSHVLVHEPQPVAMLEALAESQQDPGVLAGLLQLLTLAYRKEERPDAELEAWAR